jgi:tRNA threonylcarbamoyladenosine biosynthesis protein TsaE
MVPDEDRPARAAPIAGADRSWTYTSHSEAETDQLGAALGRALASEGGVSAQAALVALVGNLGAGKTRLARSIAVALGADERLVNSPTFILIQEYEASLPIYHCDAYRLKNVKEFLELGVDEIFQSPGVCLIEWAERVAAVLPPDHLRIEIEFAGPTSRRFELIAGGPKSARLLAATRAAR